MFFSIRHDPKQVHEAMCAAQSAIRESGHHAQDHHVHVIQDLIRECEKLRPLGPDGKHGDRHTENCRCDGPAWRGTVTEWKLRSYVVELGYENKYNLAPELVAEYKDFYKWLLGGRRW